MTLSHNFSKTSEHRLITITRPPLDLNDLQNNIRGEVYALQKNPAMNRTMSQLCIERDRGGHVESVGAWYLSFKIWK